MTLIWREWSQRTSADRYDEKVDFYTHQEEEAEEDEDVVGRTITTVARKLKKKKGGGAPNAKIPRGKTYSDKEYVLVAKAFMAMIVKMLLWLVQCVGSPN